MSVPQASNATTPDHQGHIAQSSAGNRTLYGHFRSEGARLVKDYSSCPSGSRSIVPGHQLQSDLSEVRYTNIIFDTH